MGTNNISDLGGQIKTSFENSDSDHLDVAAAVQGDSVFSNGINTLYNNMNMFSEQANDKYKMITERANFSRDAHNMSNEVDEQIANLSHQGENATVSLQPDILDFAHQASLTVDGMGIDDYLKKHGGKLNHIQLTAVKNALDTASNKASDFVSQQQLQLQKILQTYNVLVSMINHIQTLLSEMNKNIAQNIR
ncbi:secretion protein EspA [Parashewanella curva]|uniref:Secretion protein EspA n=1 Tax=Parashewanella curva TaxID=2338552 RepID=A0A3L8PWF9_9GAMM|nr:secretion protein EspA [Parashewanella curva]RLV59787.1 secretion protein EspA [Parashewanella curva]